MGQKYNRGGYGAAKKRSANPHGRQPWYKNRWNLAVLIGFSVAGLIWVLGSLDTSGTKAHGAVPAGPVPNGDAMSSGSAGAAATEHTASYGWLALAVAVVAIAMVAVAARVVQRRRAALNVIKSN